MPSLQELVGTADQIMGVKAVFGRSTVPVMCFGSHGDAALRDRAHFSLGRRTAEAAMTQPYLITICGGDEAPADIDGRILELVRVTGAYGETKAFVGAGPALHRLGRWPVAVVLGEIFEVVGEPDLISDLGFTNRNILANAYDGVRRDEKEILRLWDAIKTYPLRRRTEIDLPLGFSDPGRVVLCSTMYPRIRKATPEGERIWVLQQKAERNRGLAQDAKAKNRAANSGVLICEGCDFSHEKSVLFDAHHLNPVATGYRESTVDDFAILCPVCHRWVHYLAPDILQPLQILDLRAARKS